jgi:hypothetical protein
MLIPQPPLARSIAQPRVKPSQTWRALSIAVLVVLAPHSGHAQSCVAGDFSAAVDGAGAKLRAFNLETAPKLQSRIKALADRKGWSDQDVEEKTFTFLADPRLESFDKTANDLLARVDTLGRLEPGQTPDCAKLDELKSSGIELLAVMKAKSSYLIGRIDKELGTTTAAAAPSVPSSSKPELKSEPVPSKSAEARTVRKPVDAKPEPAPAPSSPSPSPKSAPPWSTTTAPSPRPPETEIAIASPVPIPGTNSDEDRSYDGPRPSAPMVTPNAVLLPDDGYTIDEIRDATRGFFGSVSTGLASVIEHAFAKSGRPTGYILGQEGGAAFMGGLRYGEGQLYVRTGGQQKIYWHGPSVGFDFGAAGARTLILVYKMDEPSSLYRTFSGLDGSAFVVGGVGLTLLKGGNIIMAPIRSGLGVRVGANIGYLRFTSHQTWNPF